MSLLVVNDQSEQDAVAAANGNNIWSCICHHPTLGLVIEDTWGWPEWTTWWPRYHTAGGQYHLGDPWPAEPPPRLDAQVELITAATADPPVLEAVFGRLADVTGGGMIDTPPDYSPRRTQLLEDIATLRAWVQVGRDDLTTLLAIPDPTWQQQLFIKILKFLLLLSKVIWNALLRPAAGDLDPVPENMAAKTSFMTRFENVISGPQLDSDPEDLARNVRKLTAQARIGIATGGAGFLAGLIGLLLAVL